MSNEYERPWYKNPIVVIPLIAAIIGAAGVITAAFIQRSPSEPPDEFLTVQGKITDEDKMPVVGVKVSIDGQSDITDDNGRYTIPDVSHGTKTIRVEHMNKELYKSAISIDKGGRIKSFDIVLSLTPSSTSTLLPTSPTSPTTTIPSPTSSPTSASMSEQGSDIKIVAVDQDRLGPGLIEVTDTSTGEIIYCHGIVEYLDFRIKNNGDDVALIHQLTVEVLNYSILEGYTMPIGILESSLDYCIKLETIKATPYMINKSPNIFVKPGDFDRFRLFFYSDVYARYNVTIKLYYDGKEEEYVPKALIIG